MEQAAITEKVKVWPEMVLRETIATLVAMIILLLAAIYIQAPLEEIADPSFSMNPSKAPWYFLGLQELLVYFSPWIAGVAIPLLVVLGLAAIPYLDRGRKTEAGMVYRFAARIRFVFTTGLLLWLALTIVGLYFRGPNWALQWPDGTPLGGETAAPSLDWLIPLFFAGYLLWQRLFRRKGVGEAGGNPSSLWRRCLSHLLTLVGLAVFLKIIFDTVFTLVV